MKKSTIAIIIVVLVGLGYAYTYFQVKEAAIAVFENAEIIDYELENISLIPPSADLTVYFRIFNPSSFGFSYSGETEIYIDDTFIATFVVEDEFIKADGESIIPSTVSISGGVLTLLESIIGDPVYRYEVRMEINHKIFGILPITITESESGYDI